MARGLVNEELERGIMIEANTIDSEHLALFSPDRLPHKKTLSAKGVKAQRLVKKYSALAGGVGLIPLARVSGQVVVGGILFKLLRDMCSLYGLSFSDQQYKILIASILGGAHYGWISRYAFKFMRNYSPVSYTPTGLLLRPAVSGVLVYYIGRLFLIHLESGVWHAAAKQHV